MANSDNPLGFRVLTPDPHTREVASDGSAEIGRGDLVKHDGSGQTLTITNVADNPFGVAVSHVAAVAGTKYLVYDDLAHTEFEAQIGDASLADATQNNNFFDVVITTLDTVTGNSKMEIDGDASAQDTIIVLDKINHPNNNWGTNVKVRCKIRVNTEAPVIATT